MKNVFKVFICFLLVLSACTKSSSDDNSAGNNPNLQDQTFTSDCGVVFNGQLELPIEANRGLLGVVEVVASNLVIFRGDNLELLVKLHGISKSNSVAEQNAVGFLRNLSSNTQSVFFQASEGCTTTVENGQIAAVGHLFTVGGLSFAEELVKAGFANIERNDVCQGILVGPCYQALAESEAPAGQISNFLWKPVSERDGNLVVLLNPAGATVVVNGTTLVDFGPSNGRGTTARANRSGASFGSNIRVQVFDNRGRLLNFSTGQNSLTIANGGSRVEVP